MELAAILANIQQHDDWNLNNDLLTQQSTTLDKSKYEYMVSSSLDAIAFKLSPRTLKSDEELAARLRFSQDYRYQMRSSANAKIPTLITPIVTDNNNSNNTTISGTDIERIFTFKLNSSDAIRTRSSLHNDASLKSTMDNELVQLYYDATLKRFYDLNAGKHYELTSA